MKKIMKPLLAAGMAVIVTGAASAVCASENSNKGFQNVFSSKHEGTVSPEETFVFEFTSDHVEKGNSVVNEMPKLDKVQVYYKPGEVPGGEEIAKHVVPSLDQVEWPRTGVYYYTVTMEKGRTAGVQYPENQAFMKVSVAYDPEKNTYYTAFVALEKDIDPPKEAEREDEGKDKREKTTGFQSIYEAGALEIKNEVTGNAGEKDKKFKVSVAFQKAQKTQIGAPITCVLDGTEGVMSVRDLNGSTPTAEIELLDGQSAVFRNIPYGVTYTVKEAPYEGGMGGYDAAVYKLNGNIIENTDKIEKTMDAVSDSIVIVNNKGFEIDTGILTENVPYLLLLGAAGAAIAVKKLGSGSR